MLALLIAKLAILLLVVGSITLLLIITAKLMLVHNKYKHLPGPQRDSFFFWKFLNYGESFDAWKHFRRDFSSAEVLMDNRYLKPWESYRSFVDIFGERFTGYSLVSETDHVKWGRHRRVLNPAFHRQYLMELMYVFNDSADRLVKYLSPQADGKAEVSMVDALGRVTLDVIAKVGFSMEEDMISERSRFGDAIALCFEGSRRNVTNPSLRFNPFKEAREYRAKVREAIQILRSTGEKLIKQRLKDQQDGKELPKDILSYIIKTAMVDEHFQLDEMVDEFVTFFAAGQETTSNLLCFTLICLSQNPHVLDKLLEEIDTVIGDKEELLYEDITKLEYMMLVFKETLRLFPPVVGTSRRNPEDLTCAGYKVPADTILFLASYVMSRQEQFFKDPLTFDPQRFRRNEDNPLYAYFPFSMGARSCIGQQFAMIEARIILAKLLQKLHLQLVPGQKLGIVDHLTIRPSNQCLHHITERN